MKSLLLIAASTLALSAAACAPNARPTARVALECPQTQGELTRTGIAADHKSCTYRAEDGGEVTLQLVSTNGDPQAALKALEASLLTPAPGAEPAKPAAAAEPAKTADAAAGGDAAKVAAEAKADAGKAEVADNSDPEDVNVDLPGIHIRAQDGHGNSDTAHIDLPGIHINANDETDEADVRIGGMVVNAKDDNVTVRIYREVRLRGEAMSRQKRGMRATFIHAGKQLGPDTRAVGYEAAGPKAGPITVATVRSHGDGDMHDGLYKDIRRLVRRNGGV
jgi:hypothetical protein